MTQFVIRPGLLTGQPVLLAALIVRAVNSHADLVAALSIIADDDENCTCAARSWYGDDHDGQCPISIARAALAKAEG